MKRSTAPLLASQLLKVLSDRAGIEPGELQEIVLGQVVAAGSGPAPAAETARLAGFTHARAYTLNSGWTSGLQSLLMAANTIERGDAALTMGGGMECPSATPYALPDARWGVRIGVGQVLDLLLTDGLLPLAPPPHEALVQDSLRRALMAEAAGQWQRERVPVQIRNRKGAHVFHQDEPLRPSASPLPWMPVPADGAAALLFASESRARNANPMGLLKGFAQGEEALPSLWRKLNRSAEHIDAWEVSEAFPGISLPLEVDPLRVNRWGGALALGCPWGAEGARLAVTLLHRLKEEGGRLGIAVLGDGGPQTMALALECF